jgi:hypothetical protein
MIFVQINMIITNSEQWRVCSLLPQSRGHSFIDSSKLPQQNVSQYGKNSSWTKIQSNCMIWYTSGSKILMGIRIWCLFDHVTCTNSDKLTKHCQNTCYISIMNYFSIWIQLRWWWKDLMWHVTGQTRQLG